MSTPPVAPDRAPDATPLLPAPADRWCGRAELRADLPRAAWLALGLAVAGVPAGLLWWAIAPRADFRITEDGPAVIGTPSVEVQMAGDGIFVLVLAGVGVLAGLVAWAVRRARGVTILAGLAVGTLLTGLVAWGVGTLLGRGPSEAELAEVGAVVTTPLGLDSVAALAVAPFVALLVYLLGVILNAEDGLGRTEPGPVPPPAPPPEVPASLPPAAP
ncbi:hypothetical protein [Blastococcus sp. CCUG 61487]|uniref:hypothetical protein n=1 Tax=Blastococcus sp. CCUG 61487 TaxID=1840703 RepID=UPI0010C11F2B|nr:hypothetical protein [Blastococcus sp. CCUG 61487]TKJ18188.1 hypothetical protein A6V29_11950 [Blastococcus sp. CCUG 61487]